MKKLILLSLALLMLSGCGLFNTKPLEVSVQPVKRIPLVVPIVDQYTNRVVQWVIVTPKNADAVFADLKKKGLPVVLFALTSKGYTNLSEDTGDQIKITRQMQAVIEAYKKYYVDQSKAFDDAKTK